MNFCSAQFVHPPIARLAGSWPRAWRKYLSSGVIALALGWFLLASNCCAAAGASDATATNHPAATALATNSVADSHTGLVNVLDDKYHLAIGDEISFQIIEDEDDPKQLTVTDSGDIQVPYIGRFPAAGKTCKELAAALKVQLEKDYYKQATVVIAVNSKPRSRGKVYLVGAVRAPGPQDISSDETLTVSKAILRAGGFTEFANEKEVRITRDINPGADDKTNLVVNVEQIFEKGKVENDVTLRPGDLIYVPERLIRF
jgi:protein involved in polysaccharide export with SLBB domain